MTDTDVPGDDTGIEIRFTVVVKMTAINARNYAEEFNLLWHSGDLIKPELANHVAEWARKDIEHSTLGDFGDTRIVHVTYT